MLLSTFLLAFILTFYQSVQYSKISVLNKSKDDLKLFFGHGDGFVLPLNAREGISLTVIDDFSSILWARRADCTIVKNCSYPVTTIGISLLTSNHDGSLVDMYGISVMEGYNLPVEVIPEGSECTPLSCQINLPEDCPEESRVEYNDEVVSCDVREMQSRIFKELCPDAISTANDALVECKLISSETKFVISFL